MTLNNVDSNQMFLHDTASDWCTSSDQYQVLCVCVRALRKRWLLNCSTFYNRTWYWSLVVHQSEAESVRVMQKCLVAIYIVQCNGQSEGVYIQSRLEQTFSISIVCLHDIFWTIEPFVIKLGIVVHHYNINQSVMWEKRKKKGCWKWVAVLNIKVWSMIWSFCCKLCLTSYHLKLECLVKRFQCSRSRSQWRFKTSLKNNNLDGSIPWTI